MSKERLLICDEAVIFSLWLHAMQRSMEYDGPPYKVDDEMDDQEK